MQKLLALCLLCSGVSAFYREECNATVRNMLLDGTLAANDNQTFFTNGLGIIMSNPENPTLTLEGCNRICGAQQHWYKDSGPRLSMWLMPVLLLIVNMEVSSLDKRRYFTIIHLLGDPVDTTWSLLSKLEVWNRCHALGRFNCDLNSEHKNYKIDAKILATVLGGIEEIMGPDTDVLQVLSELIPTEQRGKHLWNKLSIAALKLADGRTDDLFRTTLAVLLFGFSMLAAFMSVIGGGNNSPPGGRIGTTMFLTWLIPVILLSNAMGSFSSGRTCFDAIQDLCRSVEARAQNGHSDTHSQIDVGVQSELVRRIRARSPYFEEQAWNGNSYSCLYRKTPAFRATKHNHGQVHLFCLAVMPLFTASVFASAILWMTPPRGFNCRNIMIIGTMLAWLLSCGLTWSLSNFRRLNKRVRWISILVKDAVFAAASVLMIVLSSVGLFNSCQCWSGSYYLVRDRARVPLNTNAEFERNYSYLYPALVITCVALQIIIFAYIVWLQWMSLRVLRWSTSEKTFVHSRLGK